MSSVRIRYAAGFAAAAFTAAAVAGCSSNGSSSTAASAPSSAASSMPASPSTSAAAMTNFGPGCSAVPASGSGSFTGMAQDPVATAASNNPVLSTLVTAAKAGGLVDTLNNAQGVTVFAPDNAAFSAVPPATLSGLLANKTQLDKVLTYHVVAGRLSPEQLAGTHTTLEGGSVTVAGSGEDFTVNGSAKVVCGNVQTANATVYIIDSVLTPSS